MSVAPRTLRFRTAGSAGFVLPDAHTVADLFLNEETFATGHIVLLQPEPGTPARWAYVLADGRATGLQSTHSRAALESSVADYYFAVVDADQRCSA